MIDDLLKELQEAWDFTTETLNHVRSCMAQYAQAAIMDSDIAKEALQICEEEGE